MQPAAVSNGTQVRGYRRTFWQIHLPHSTTVPVARVLAATSKGARVLQKGRGELLQELKQLLEQSMPPPYPAAVHMYAG